MELPGLEPATSCDWIPRFPTTHRGGYGLAGTVGRDLAVSLAAFPRLQWRSSSLARTMQRLDDQLIDPAGGLSRDGKGGGADPRRGGAGVRQTDTQGRVIKGTVPGGG